MLWRDEQGFTQTQRLSDMSRLEAFVAEGALLGHLWMEGHFGVGDPLVNHGGPTFSPR